MEENRTEDIMKNYERAEKNYIRTGKNTEYLKKVAEIKEKQVEQNRIGIHVSNMEKELESISDKHLREEYQRQINEGKKELEAGNVEIEKLENEKQEMLVQKKRDERVLRESIKGKVNELQDRTRKELMAEKKNLETQISSKKLEFENKKKELETKKIEESQFVYSYSENNGQNLKKLKEETQRVEKETSRVKEELDKLQSMSNKCDVYRERLVTPFKMPPELPDDMIYLGFENEKNNNKEQSQAENKQKEEMKETEKSPKMDFDLNSRSLDKNIFETKDIIDNAKQDLENENRNYGNIHLNLDPNEKIQENPIDGATRKNDKNVFEINNAIENARNDLGIKMSKPEAANRQDNTAKPQQVSSDQDVKQSNKIKSISINESEGNILYEDESGRKEELSIIEVLENKKSQFKRLDIKNICKEIAGGRLKGMLLGRKVNPEIVSVLQNDPEQLKDYIASIYQNKELPFELTHNLEGIGLLKKFQMNKFVKSEEKMGAKVIGKLFDKNRAIEGSKGRKMIEAAKEGVGKGVDVTKEQAVKLKNKAKDFVPKISNKDNHIEEKANEAIKQSQEQTAKDVQEIMNQKDNEEVK